jgi:hypothetical protein
MRGSQYQFCGKIGLKLGILINFYLSPDMVGTLTDQVEQHFESIFSKMVIAWRFVFSPL